MGYIKEPNDIDFTVINRDLTPAEKSALSEVIQKDKMTPREQLLISVTPIQKSTLLQLFELLDVQVIVE